MKYLKDGLYEIEEKDLETIDNRFNREYERVNEWGMFSITLKMPNGEHVEFNRSRAFRSYELYKKLLKAKYNIELGNPIIFEKETEKDYSVAWRAFGYGKPGEYTTDYQEVTI